MMKIRNTILLSFFSLSTLLAGDDVIDKYAKDTLKEWDIPGLALSIVHKGKEIKVKGYGIRQRGAAALVDADTIFQIASLTKAFTALTVQQLVAEGKLDWERPIQSYLPSFALKDPIATKEMTLRDLLCHQTGLPGISQQSWRLWYLTDRSTQDLIQRLAFVDPVYPFRSHFTYNNMAYVIASEIVSQESGVSWGEICLSKIFKPLGMSRTDTSHNTLMHDSNVAAPHWTRDLYEPATKWGNWDSLAAAAGINSTARDMAKWLNFCLKSPLIKDIQKPQTLFEVAGFLRKDIQPAWPLCIHNQAITNYGLGWMMYTLDNKVIYFHSGLTDGMQSLIAVIPEEELGIAILTNEAFQCGTECLLNTLIDHFFRKAKYDWHKKAHALLAEINKTTKEQVKAIEASRNKELPSTLVLADYCGSYRHPAYGIIEIEVNESALDLILFSHEKGTLTHWQEDEFLIKEVPSGPVLPWIVTFQLSEDRKSVVSLEMPELGVFERDNR